MIKKIIFVILLIVIFGVLFKKNDTAYNEQVCRVYGKMPDCVTPLNNR